jgi:hypothetical protein
MASLLCKNKNGTSERSCDCGSWKKHWLNFSNQKWPNTCSVYGCDNVAEVGAHIFATNVDDKSEYIIPMCKKCNARTDEFTIKQNRKVSANISKTCGKKQ